MLICIIRKEQIFRNIYNKRLDKIEDLPTKNDYCDFNFIVQSGDIETDFTDLKTPVALLDSIKKRELLIEKA